MNDAFTPISGIPDRLDLVIFDCDGVLIDSEYLACRSIVDTFAQYGITVPVELLLSRLVGTTDNSLRTQLESFGYAIPSEAFDRLESEILNRFRTELRPIAGMHALLEDLAPKICVASNSSVRRLKLSLGVTRLDRYFGGHVFSAEHVVAGKPDPALFLHAAKSMSAAPQNCLIIEDSAHGLTAAKSAGIAALGFCGGAHCQPGHAHALQKNGAIATCADVGELRSWLSVSLKANTAPV